MDEIAKKLAEQDAKLEQIWRSVEKTRKYFLWTLVITLVTLVLPLLGLIFAIPMFIRTLGVSGLGL